MGTKPGNEEKGEETKEERGTLSEVELPPAEVRKKLQGLKRAITENFWETAQLLFHVWDKQLWEKWGYQEGNDGWNTFIEKECDFHRRTAYNIISVWHWFGIKQENNPKIVSKLQGLGWRKIVALVDVATEENVDEWVAHAKKTPVTQFESNTKAYREKHQKAAEEGKRAPLSPVQGGRVKPYQFLMQDEQIDVMDEALKHAQSISGSEVKSELMHLIALEYNATRRWMGQPGKDLAAAMSQYEALLHRKIIVVNPQTKEVEYGGDTVVELAKAAEKERKKDD